MIGSLVWVLKVYPKATFLTFLTPELAMFICAPARLLHCSVEYVFFTLMFSKKTVGSNFRFKFFLSVLLEGRGIPLRVIWLYLSPNPLTLILLLLNVTPLTFFNPSWALEIPFFFNSTEPIEDSMLIFSLLSSSNIT